MMINFLIVLAIVALAAWLGNLLLAVEAAVSQARARVRSVKDAAGRLEGTIVRLQREEEAINKEIAEIGESLMAQRRKQSEVQQALVEATQKRRPRLLILSDRRNPNDREWLVVVTNSQIAEIDGSHPLAQEWRTGREYLVWAESDREAAERAARRFNAKPGFAVRSVQPIKENLFGGARPVAAVT